MTDALEKRVELNDEGDIVAARRAGRQMARDMGFGMANQTRLATAISELTRNAIEYADGGICIITDKSDQTQIRLLVTVEDHGPGIPSIEDAMKDGFSTGRGLGAGLPGTKRLVQEFSIESEPGHTRVNVAVVRPRVQRGRHQ